MLKNFFYLIVAFSLLLCASVKAEKVKMGLSAFQDVYSVFVGIDQGYWEDEGIELELTYSDWGGTNELGVADKVDVWIWQNKGVTRWDYQNPLDVEKSCTVNEGDLIYIPKGVYHKANSVTARFSITMFKETEEELTRLNERSI